VISPRILKRGFLCMNNSKQRVKANQSHRFLIGLPASKRCNTQLLPTCIRGLMLNTGLQEYAMRLVRDATGTMAMRD
jgi:hypothetical protein